MARTFATASSQYLSRTDSATLSYGDEDMSWSVWVYLGSLATTSAIFAKRSAATKEYAVYYFHTGDAWYFDINDVGTCNVAAGAATNTWYHLTGYYNATTNELGIALDAGTPGTGAHAGGFNDGGSGLTVGRYADDGASGDFYLEGRVAELAFWRGAVLDSAERAGLAKGVSPLLIRPASLETYWPLWGRASPEPDYVNGQTLTLNNTPTAGDHPRIFYPQAQQTIRYGTAAAPAGDAVPVCWAQYRRRHAG